MTLQEIFDQLTYGELSQLAIGGRDAGVIDEENHQAVLVHINLGLTSLYKRFKLKEGRVLVELVTDRTEYPLTSKFARANTRSRELTKYLVDSSSSPFQDDILKIERVLTEDGFEFALNNEANKYSVFTPSATTIRLHSDVVELSSELPEELKTSRLEVVYRAGHPKIVKGLGMFDPARIQVQLPDSHLEALLLFVASRVHNPVGMVGEFNAGNNYAMKYEGACLELEGQGLQIDHASTAHGKFTARGWA